jgi:hypothetical protein
MKGCCCSYVIGKGRGLASQLGSVAALATTTTTARDWAGSVPMAEAEQPEATMALLLHGVSQGCTRNGARGR